MFNVMDDEIEASSLSFTCRVVYSSSV